MVEPRRRISRDLYPPDLSPPAMDELPTPDFLEVLGDFFFGVVDTSSSRPRHPRRY